MDNGTSIGLSLTGNAIIFSGGITGLFGSNVTTMTRDGVLWKRGA